VRENAYSVKGVLRNVLHGSKKIRREFERREGVSALRLTVFPEVLHRPPPPNHFDKRGEVRLNGPGCGNVNVNDYWR
jgi:hypothetical protein